MQRERDFKRVQSVTRTSEIDKTSNTPETNTFKLKTPRRPILFSELNVRESAFTQQKQKTNSP
jgi:hypothetical protein